jgi:hypothetical protein
MRAYAILLLICLRAPIAVAESDHYYRLTYLASVPGATAEIRARLGEDIRLHQPPVAIAHIQSYDIVDFTAPPPRVDALYRFELVSILWDMSTGRVIYGSGGKRAVGVPTPGKVSPLVPATSPLPLGTPVPVED